jgi:8-oxo-dGTP diphosphatase
VTEERQVVVGAVIVDAGRVLAARRTRPADLAGHWEFPGGKAEVGEDPRDALVREIREELSASVAVGDEVRGDGAGWPISAGYVLRLFRASVVAGELQPGTDHDLLRWLAPDDLESLDWLPSDRLALPVVRASVSSDPVPRPR